MDNIIIRESYLEKIRPFYDSEYIKAITGIRRCGKSELLLQIIDEIKAKGELVGIHKLSSTFYHQLCAEYEKIVTDKPKLGYEYQLLWMSQHLSPVYVLNAHDVKWYEIDDEDDLKYAEEKVVVGL